MNAVSSLKLCFDALPTQAVVVKRDDTGWPSVGNAVTLTNFSTNGMPDPADVRDGVEYGPSDSLEGTGHAVLTPAEVWGVLVSALTVPDSIGERVKDAATVATVGAQLAAALNRT